MCCYAYISFCYSILSGGIVGTDQVRPADMFGSEVSDIHFGSNYSVWDVT